MAEHMGVIRSPLTSPGGWSSEYLFFLQIKKVHQKSLPSETNIAPENGWLEVSFRVLCWFSDNGNSQPRGFRSSSSCQGTQAVCQLLIRENLRAWKNGKLGGVSNDRLVPGRPGGKGGWKNMGKFFLEKLRGFPRPTCIKQNGCKHWTCSFLLGNGIHCQSWHRWKRTKTHVGDCWWLGFVWWFTYIDRRVFKS